MEGDELGQERRIALALPGVTERVSHGEPCFFVHDRRPLCYFHDDHGGDGRISLWCPAPPGVPDDPTACEPDRFFCPTPSASGVFANWLGIYLDTDGDDRVDWKEIAGILEDAFRTVAAQGAHPRTRRPLTGEIGAADAEATNYVGGLGGGGQVAGPGSQLVLATPPRS